jgi:hypothetical protein
VTQFTSHRDKNGVDHERRAGEGDQTEKLLHGCGITTHFGALATLALREPGEAQSLSRNPPRLVFADRFVAVTDPPAANADAIFRNGVDGGDAISHCGSPLKAWETERTAQVVRGVLC